MKKYVKKSIPSGYSSLTRKEKMQEWALGITLGISMMVVIYVGIFNNV